MRILYIDCDALRPDHLGCYGYHRDTSPTIDRLAEDARRFTNYYVSDAPCLPSRTALFSGRFGIHTGAVNHGGTNASPRGRGAGRGFNTRTDEYRSWMAALGQAGHRAALISSFPSRHGAWHVVDGFDEWTDPGGNGNEGADVVTPLAEEWLEAHATTENWYLHVNFWDPHTPYETPSEYGDPFAAEPAPEWLDEATIRRQYDSYGPHSAQEPHGWGDGRSVERMPQEIASRDDFKQWIDGYDTGIRYMDDHIGRLFEVLEDAGVFEDTLIIVSADHGENQGECNVYGDHQTADEMTSRVPLLVRGPGVEPGTEDGLYYHIDLPPTITEIAGGDVPAGWDGRSFRDALTDDADGGRDFLVVSQGAWSCQRAVRWDDWLMIRTYHDGLKEFDPVELYDIAADPHETSNLARTRDTVVREGLAFLEQWRSERLTEAAIDEAGENPASQDAVTDPLWAVIREGGPHHARADDHVESYGERLRSTGREGAARKLETHRGIVPGDVDAYLDGQNVW